MGVRPDGRSLNEGRAVGARREGSAPQRRAFTGCAEGNHTQVTLGRERVRESVGMSIVVARDFEIRREDEWGGEEV